MQVRLFGDLRKRLSELPKQVQKIVLQDLETAATNRIIVMERVKH
jgi:hypothetical protein